MKGIEGEGDEPLSLLQRSPSLIEHICLLQPIMVALHDDIIIIPIINMQLLQLK